MNDNMSNQDPNSSPMPSAPKKNNMPMIIGAVIVIVLCGCCVAGIVAYQYGDQILKAMQGG